MRIPMTPTGYEALKTELERLRKVDRPQNIRDIAEAREHGDLRENAEFKAAKERQAFLDKRISEIEQNWGRRMSSRLAQVPATPWFLARPSAFVTWNQTN